MLAGLLLSHSRRRHLLLLDAQDRVQARWRMTDPSDGFAVEAFSHDAARVSIATQRRAVSLVSAVQRRYLHEMGTEIGDFIPEVPDEVRLYSTTRPYRYAEPRLVRTSAGVSQRLPVTEVWNRPARRYRRMLEDGRDPNEALDVTAARVKMELAMNVALAEREAESQIIGRAGRVDPEVIGWRRVIRPELARTGSCGLCVAASDRIYRTDELKPLHTGCNCAVLPVKHGSDPGRSLNREDLDRIYGDAGGTAAELLHRTKYRVDEHGELQALLVPVRRGEPVPRLRGAIADDATPNTHRQLSIMRKLLAATQREGLAADDPRLLWQRGQVRRYERIVSAA